MFPKNRHAFHSPKKKKKTTNPRQCYKHEKDVSGEKRPVTIASLVASLLLSAASVFASATMNSSAVLASGLDTFLAIFSAGVVIWRFRDETNGKIGPEREKQGSIAFAIAFAVDALVTITVSIVHLTDEMKPRHSEIMWPSLLCFSFVYGILSALELWISAKLRSSVLVALCIDDVLTGGLLFGLAMNAFIVDRLPYLWYLDHRRCHWNFTHYFNLRHEDSSGNLRVQKAAVSDFQLNY